jgi:hypothetical protein
MGIQHAVDNRVVNQWGCGDDMHWVGPWYTGRDVGDAGQGLGVEVKLHGNRSRGKWVAMA